MITEAHAQIASDGSELSDPRFRAFVENCLILDLEVDKNNERIVAIGAVRGNRKLHLPNISSSEHAVRKLDEFGSGTDFVVGHNIVAHDRRFIEQYLPQSSLLELPVVDTLYLSPLANPQRPYHRLVKDYKLIGAEPNNPVADCHLTLELLKDCWEILRSKGKQDPWLLSVYRSCFVDLPCNGNLSLLLDGTGVFIEQIGGRMLANHVLAKGVKHFAGDSACSSTLHRLLPALLNHPQNRPVAAYSVAWLMVASTESVLPRWVHYRFPEAAKFIRQIRSVSCGRPGCGYCSIHHNPERKLQEYFGFEGFRSAPATSDGESLQKRIVEERIAGESVMTIMPTGGGKSLGFQLPAIVHNEQTGALTVVISPLQALMKDQVENLNKRTEILTLAATLNGLQTMIERREVLEGIRLGQYALLYVSPEQLRSRSFASAIRHREIAAWVFDEAHCISKWGHDFRPDYLYAARFIKEFSEEEGVPIAPIACFTATAKPDVREDIRSHLRSVLGKKLKVLAADRIDRKNLSFSVEETPNARKAQRIDELLRNHIAGMPGSAPQGAAIIYARSRHRAENFAEKLRLQGWEAKHFHGGLDPPEKKRVQDAFISGDTPIIVATNAFGMGIDKPDVRLVVHADVPASIESYLQEAGRAGRDGQRAQCVLLFAKGDLERQFDLVSGSRLIKRDIAQILRAIRQARRRDTEEIVVSPGELLRTPDADFSFDDDDRYASTRVKTAVSWLERAKFLLRNENRTRLYQGVPAVRDLKESLEKVKALDLPPSKKGEWMQVLNLLHHADLREGIEVDRIASLPFFRSRLDTLAHRHPDDPARANRAITQEIFRTLHEMTRAGVLESGFYFSAWVHHKTKNRSIDRLDQIAQAQTTLVDTLKAEWPEAGAGQEFEVSIPQLQEQLRSQLGNILSDSLLTLLGGWGRKITQQDSPLSLQSHGRRRLGMRLDVSWDELTEQLETRNEVGRVILKALGDKADQRGFTGERLVLFSLEELHRAIEEHLGLGDQIDDPFTTLEKTLLFLDEHHVIRLERGLSVFRQAMTICIRKEAKGRRYSERDYEPLRAHYQERVFQIHAIGRYAEESHIRVGKWSGTYLDDYFRLTNQQFKRRYFRGQSKSVKRATSAENYSEIVKSLKNPDQERIVTAPTDRNLLVLAGPGSGKTRVVVHRAAYLLIVKRIRPERLLVICFNRSAMHELRVKLRELVGDVTRRVAVHTYHSLALQITERSIAERIQVSGDRQINFDEIIRDANRLLSGKAPIIGAEPDQLRDRLLSGFEYLLVDEYQDIDQAQYQMITHIAQRAGQEDDADRRATILAVGDDDQNIYTWRGANVRFLRHFEKDFGAERHYLVENYRSTGNIITASNALIQRNRDRMKLRHHIRINAARADEPKGGRWAALDSLTGGRVSHLQVRGPGLAAVSLSEIERLRELDKTPEWENFAVLAWSHADLAPVRALLEKKGVPVRRSIPEGLPRLDRIREFKLLLEYLKSVGPQRIRIPDLLEELPRICGAGGRGTVWVAMANRMLEALQEEVGIEAVDATTVTGAIHQGLADHHRSHLIGQGVLVSTIHAAKGLEFDHVLVLGGRKRTARKEPRSPEEERRLYYVALTRARQTLTLIDSAESPNPYFRQIGPHVLRRTTTVANPESPDTDLEYQVLGMKDLYLDLAGTKTPGDPIHRRLLALQAGDFVTLANGHNGRVRVLDTNRKQVARLSTTAARQWSTDRLAATDEVRILGIVARTKDESDAIYQHRLRAERWETPLLEVRTRKGKRPRLQSGP